MCFYVEISYSAQTLQNRYPLSSAAEIPQLGRLNGYAHPELLILAKDYKPLVAHWGLIPNWCRDDKKAGELRKMTLNARVETAHRKPSFRSAFKQHRCVVPVSGFYEYQDIGKRKKKQWYVTSDEPILSLAGIFDYWERSSTTYLGFSVLTQDATDDVVGIHDRMPVIVDGCEEEWLTKGRLSITATELNLSPIPRSS